MPSVRKRVLLATVVVLTVSLVFFACSQGKQESAMKWRIQPFRESGISCDGKQLAFLLGTPSEAHHTRLNYVCILDLASGEIVRIRNSQTTRFCTISWKSSGNENVLYFRTHKKTLFGDVIHLWEVTAGGRILSRRRTGDNLQVIGQFQWSPDGRMLAGGCNKNMCFGVFWPATGNLMTLSDIKCFFQPPVWIDQQSLFVSDFEKLETRGNHTRIVKVRIGHDKLMEVEVIAEHSGFMRLHGCIAGKCVYQIEDDLFVGPDMIADAGGVVRVDGDYIAVETSSTISVIDQHGKIISSRARSEDQHLLALSACTNTVYLVDNFQRIVCGSLSDPEDTQVIFCTEGER